MREMRLTKREIQDKSILMEIIEACDVVRIGLTDSEGMFIVPVNYGYDLDDCGDGLRLTLYIHGAREGRKAEAFSRNPSVAIEMDYMHEVITGDYTCSYSYAYRSIMGTGTVRELAEEQEKIHGLTRIMKHTAPDAEIEFLPEMLERTGVYCIDVTHFTGKERKKKQADMTRK